MRAPLLASGARRSSFTTSSFPCHRGTPAKKVRAAVRKLAVNEFALQHRYALVLHTDEAHPHVHLVIKAESEQGVRLNIRKGTLRHWREQFAENLRDLGIAANATERAVRDEVRTPKKDGIYRAAQRGESTRQKQEVRDLRERAPSSLRRFARGSETLQRTRAAVVEGWHGVARQLEEVGAYELAEDVQRFVERMPPPALDQMQLVNQLRARSGPQRIDRPLRVLPNSCCIPVPTSDEPLKAGTLNGCVQ